MLPQPRPVKLTLEDYRLFPDDGKRHELIDGEHYMAPAPNIKHQTTSSNLHRIMSAFIHERRMGHLFTAPTDVILSDADVVQPDLLFVSAARAAIITETHIQGPPDLVIEILSEGTRKTDEITKRKLYERFGVREYWIVDPELESIKIYRMTDRGYSRTAELNRETNDTLITPLLPDLRIPLGELLG